MASRFRAWKNSAKRLNSRPQRRTRQGAYQQGENAAAHAKAIAASAAVPEFLSRRLENVVKLMHILFLQVQSPA
jgi:hypothetical protein